MNSFGEVNGSYHICVVGHNMQTHKLILLFFLATIFVINAFGQPEQERFIVNVTLTGFKDSTKFYLVNIDSTRDMDSALLLNDKLVFEGQVTNPNVFRLSPETKDVYCNFWIENKVITITGTKDSFSLLKISGSPLNDVNRLVESKHFQLDKQRDSLVQKAFSQSDEKAANAIWKKISVVDSEVQHIRLQTIATVQPSLVTMQELYFLRNDLTQDSLKMLFNRFPPSLKRTKYGEVITEYLATNDIKKGNHYINIFGRNLANKQVHLSDFNGKIILLDFWASWCGPCRPGNHDLIELFSKYRQSGFEIVSFSLDTNPEDWKKASEKDSITWTNISDLNGYYSKQAASYKIRAIPKSFLIDRNGIITEIFTGYDSENGKKNLDKKIAELLKQ